MKKETTSTKTRKKILVSKIRPEDDYMHRASWGELHILTRHWKTDMDFYNDELRFLRELINKYFIWLIKKENISQVQAMANKLHHKNKEHKEISEKIEKHLKHLEELMENAYAHDEQEFRDEHAELEHIMVEFVKSFRLVKKEVFSITGHVMEEEKLRHLLLSST